MLKTFKHLFRKPADRPRLQVIGPDEHPISPGDISRGARKIVDVLEKAGFQAFVVGGCVRDLLLGEHPKDFDVATDATPEQVRQLFRRSRIVGRRFRIVHVRMGPEVIEVTTFRAPHSTGDGRHEASQSDQGLLLRDNTFGNIEEDALRRDFTMNALYYHPRDNTIYDYANGVAAIDRGEVRIIGDARERYREDPVRMLRAVRFSAKLGFSIEPRTAEPIAELKHLLQEIPPARLFDEVLKLFLSGQALATYNALQDCGLFEPLFSLTARQLADNDPSDQRFIELALVNTDKRIRNDKGVTPAFLLAAILWPVVYRRSDSYRQLGDSPPYALQRAAGEVIAEQCESISIPRRFSLGMREIWDMQLRLRRRSGKRAERLLEMSRFRAGYDFLLLREEAGEISPGLGEWWTRYQEADSGKRQKMVAALNDRPRRKRRKRRPRTLQQT